MRPHILLSAALGLGLVSGCGGGTTGSGPNLLPELVGTWDASIVEWVKRSDPSVSFELIGQGGSLTLTVTADGR
ncbi:MAG: hypothetical protein ACE5HQ_02230 [Gemmatimonadota bacterium]